MMTSDRDGALLVPERLAAVRERIAAACARAGRPRDSVRLVAVSKRIPLPSVLAACRAGQWDLGENRVADALARQDELAAALAAEGLDPSRVRWHFIGHLQRNKAGKASGRFRLLHGVDSPALATMLADRAAAAGRAEHVLLEVNISGEQQKHGVQPDGLSALLDHCAGAAGLQVDGLMGMAAWDAPPAAVSSSFALLRRLAEDARRRTGLALPELSMGMSGDFELAVAEGATIVRVGGAIFGPRTA
jgi:pyridoxal phosphate enzyme (YggS family)